MPARRNVRTKRGRAKVAKVMREYHAGELHSGGGGLVQDPAQAKAIAMSEGRKADRRRGRGGLAR